LIRLYLHGSGWSNRCWQAVSCGVVFYGWSAGYIRVSCGTTETRIIKTAKVGSLAATWQTGNAVKKSKNTARNNAENYY
jgi:hypothetical protein